MEGTFQVCSAWENILSKKLRIKKIKLKSKHEHLTQCHRRAIFNFLPDRSTCFHHRQLFE